MASVVGFQTRMGQRLAGDLQARVLTAAEITSERVERDLKRSAAPFRDTGETEAGISVDTYGGPGPSGFRGVGIIATSKAESSEWLDKGTGRGGSISRPSGKAMPVGKRSPYRPNAGRFRGLVSSSPVVSGQPATQFFSRPNGIPLAVHIRNVFYGVYRGLR